MNKRALMLTAASAALLSGHAYGATCSSAQTTYCDIVTEVTAPLYTGAVNPDVSNGISTIIPTTNPSGSVTIDTDGELVIGTNPPSAPAITINTTNTGTAAPAIVNNTTNITYVGINSTVGVLLSEASPNPSSGYGVAENNIGEFVNGSTGTLNLTGAGADKYGILVAGEAYYNNVASSTTVGEFGNAPTGIYPGNACSSAAGAGCTTPTGLGLFTGGNVIYNGATAGTVTPGNNPVAIDLVSGSTLEVQGTNSYGIALATPLYTQSGALNVPTGGASLYGDIDVAGSIIMTPTTVGATATGSQNVAINIAGWMQNPTSLTTPNPAFAGTAFSSCACAMVGNLHILQGGEISSEGQGAQGIAVYGAINGYIENDGTITTFGTSAPSTALNAADPEAGSALAVANNVTGGIYNAGPTASSITTAATGAITMSGNTFALEIAPAFNPSEQVPVTIGGYTDSIGDEYSLLNRGHISASSEDANSSNEAIDIQGQSGAVVNLPFGIFNSGTISSSATTNADGSVVTATAVHIRQYVTIGEGLPSVTGNIPTYTDSMGHVQNYTFVNSSEAGSGSIAANVSGTETGTATAILIDGPSSGSANNSVASIYNTGTITASASTETLTSTTIAAYGIRDQSGTLDYIFNSGIISATSTQLDDNLQVAVAIDTSSNTTTPVTITDQATAANSATIEGDVKFGTLNGTLIVTGTSQTDSATVAGNIYFNNATKTNDQITINNFGTVSGEIVEQNGGSLNIQIAQSGTLEYLTALPTNLNSTVSTKVVAGTALSVGTLDVANGGTLNLSVSQGYNISDYHGVAVIEAQSATIGDPTGSLHPLMISFGGFVAAPSSTPAQFVLIDSPSTIQISATELGDLAKLYNGASNGSNGVPFLFTSSICAYNTSSQIAATTCSAAEPINSTNSEIVLSLTPKPATGVGGLGLSGYALKMFPYVNEALVNDNTLGAAMVESITNQQSAQAAYASFAPDVSGATRAVAISLTDSSSNVVAARQRELRMYGNQEGATTLWGQQFGQRLTENNSNTLTGYNDSGYGFAMGMDDGDVSDGRYGGALTFFTGGMSQKEPTQAKTEEEYVLLTGYTDWRGKGLFLDTQLTAGYGNLKGKRYLTLTDTQSSTPTTLTREADGNRPTEMIAGGFSTGAILTAGSTVFMPQISVDGLSLREEGYTEANGGEGFDLQVQPYYANSLRAFLGSDIREDFNFGSFYFQPEIRAGYRYDFVRGAVKLKANFASVDTANGQVYDPFTIEGPDPGHGNVVLGGGAAVTTGAWSIGFSFDYLKTNSGPSEQTGIITLLGRI